MLKILVLLIFLVLFVLGSGSFAMASTCPLGAGEDHLTIQRVMRNFGKYTAAADDVIRAGASSAVGASLALAMDPSAVAGDEDILRAIGDLAIVSACASESANATTPDLLPPSARRDPAIASQFKSAMTVFMNAVEAESQALQLARSSHDFTEARAKKQIVDHLADEAHSHF